MRTHTLCPVHLERTLLSFISSSIIEKADFLLRLLPTTHDQSFVSLVPPFYPLAPCTLFQVLESQIDGQTAAIQVRVRLRSLYNLKHIFTIANMQSRKRVKDQTNLRAGVTHENQFQACAEKRLLQESSTLSCEGKKYNRA